MKLVFISRINIKKHTFLFLLALFISSKGLAQNRFNLREAINYTLENNLHLKQALVTEANTKIDIYQAKESLYPNLNATSSTNLNYGRSLDPSTNLYLAQNSISATGSLSSNVVIFQGFEKLNQIKQNKLILESDKSATQKLRNDLTLQVVSTYLSILNNEDQLAAAKSQYQLAIQQLAAETKNFDVGKKMLADLSLAKSKISKSEVDITTIQNQLNTASVELIQMMNLSPGSQLELRSPEDNIIEQQTDTSVNEVYEYAVKTFPEIKQTEYAKLAAAKGVEIARGHYYPNLSLSGVVASNYLHETQSSEASLFNLQPAPFFRQLHTNLYEYISLNLNIPIFNGFAAKIAISKAKLNLENADIADKIAKNTLYGVINQAEGDLQAAEKNYLSSQTAYESAAETFHVTQKRYLNGLSSSIDLNQAQNDMNQAQFKAIYSKYDLIFKNKVIDFYLGKPISY